MNKWIISAFVVAVCVVYSSADCSLADLGVISACETAFGTAFTQAGQSKVKVCAAFETFIACTNKVSSGCKSDPAFNQPIDQIKNQVGTFGCSSAASGVYMSVLATVMAFLTAYLFMN